ncbi:MAG: hypothetical protein L7S64_10340 [Longimicrobiales bacterium]|jgi:hypothetical protein|nr:hypothetical protein [Longimicrobiales bacterium]
MAMPPRTYHNVTAFVVLVLAACGGESLPETIDRDVFVNAYADLRIAAVETDSGRIASAARDSILAAFEITEADLTVFAEVHAEELEFMRDIWNDVELLMDEGDEVGN